jgi:transposase-like protein
MLWKECSVMDERLRFVARLLDGEAVSEVCRALGISRKTGYKIFERYKQHGLEALTDLAPAGSLRQPAAAADREPDRRGQARQAPLGCPQIRELLVRRLDGDIRVPAQSTIHAVLHRHGLVKVLGRRDGGGGLGGKRNWMRLRYFPSEP